MPLTTPAAETPNVDVAPKVFHLEGESIAASTEEETIADTPADMDLKVVEKAEPAEEPLHPAAHDNPFDQSIREVLPSKTKNEKNN